MNNAVVDVADSEFAENAAFGSSIEAGGGAFYLEDGSKGHLVRATLRGNVAHSARTVQGGAAFLFSDSSMALNECHILGNAASNATERAAGGAFAISPPSQFDIISSQVSDNEVAVFGLRVTAKGGAVYIALCEECQVTIRACTLIGNRALAEKGLAAGGSVYLDARTDVSIADTTVVESRVRGAEAEGGALWSAAAMLSVTNVSLVGSSASAYGMPEGWARGGAVFLAAGQARFIGCRLVGSRAIMEAGKDSANLATGGGLYVMHGTRAELEGCRLQDNAAGGKGSHNYLSLAAYAEKLDSSARHIHSAGHLALRSCELIDDSRVGVTSPMWWWIVSEGGTVVLQNSSFVASMLVVYDPCQLLANDGVCQGSVEGCREGGDYADCGIDLGSGSPAKFLHVISPETEVLLDGCTFVNLTMQSALAESIDNAWGIVNCTFDPSLDSAAVSTVQPPQCGTKRAGERTCDPRALCEPLESGGVRCSCVGDGLATQNGALPNGRQCEQQTSIKLLTQASHITMSVLKPTLGADFVAVVFAAAGEKGFNASYDMTMTRFRPSHGAPQEQKFTAHGWSSIDQRRMSLDGHHVIWKGILPSEDSAVDLNAAAGKFSFSRTFELSIELNCTAGEPCVEDGDIVNTVVTAVSAVDALASEVKISATVESLVSCDHSSGWIEGLKPHDDSVSTLFAIKVHFVARDCDGLPIKYTRAEFNVSFGNQGVPHAWKGRGSNEYAADVPAELTAQPGVYDLVVSASNAWNVNATVPATRCELLRRTIIVKEGLSTSWILVGSSTAAVIVVSGLAIVVRKRHAHLEAILTMLLTEMGMLVFSICTALANLTTDGIVFGRLLRGELKVSSEIYTAAYATILCFGVVATALSLGYRIRNARLMNAQLQLLAPQGHARAASEARRQSQQHEWELVQTHRSKVSLSLSLASVAAQGVVAPRTCASSHSRLTVFRCALQICRRQS